jgi:hypothetical protein
MRLSSGQLAVFDPVGLVGGSAEPSFPVGVIIGIIPRKPDYFAVSLKANIWVATRWSWRLGLCYYASFLFY